LSRKPESLARMSSYRKERPQPNPSLVFLWRNASADELAYWTSKLGQTWWRQYDLDKGQATIALRSFYDALDLAYLAIGLNGLAVACSCFRNGCLASHNPYDPWGDSDAHHDYGYPYMWLYGPVHYFGMWAITSIPLAPQEAAEVMKLIDIASSDARISAAMKSSMLHGAYWQWVWSFMSEPLHSRFWQHVWNDLDLKSICFNDVDTGIAAHGVSHGIFLSIVIPNQTRHIMDVYRFPQIHSLTVSQNAVEECLFVCDSAPVTLIADVCASGIYHFLFKYGMSSAYESWFSPCDISFPHFTQNCFVMIFFQVLNFDLKQPSAFNANLTVATLLSDTNPTICLNLPPRLQMGCAYAYYYHIARGNILVKHEKMNVDAWSMPVLNQACGRLPSSSFFTACVNGTLDGLYTDNSALTRTQLAQMCKDMLQQGERHHSQESLEVAFHACLHRSAHHCYSFYGCP